MSAVALVTAWTVLTAGAWGGGAPPRDTVFRAFTLAEAARAALATHPALGVARASSRSAEAEVRAARSALLPSLTSSARVTRFEEPMVVAPLHGFDPTEAPDFDRTLATGHLRARWTVWDGGARGARIDGAGAAARAADAGADAAAMAVTMRVVEAYLDALGARDVLGVRRARAEALEAEVSRAARLLEEGAVPRVDRLRAEAAASAARADVEGARADLSVALAGLARLTGVPAGSLTPDALADVALAGEAAPDVSAGALAGASVPGDHPALEALRARVDAAEAGVRLARAALLPTVAGTGGYDEFGSAEGDFTGEWQAGVTVEYPVFTGGARDAAVERARADLEGVRSALAEERLALEEAADRARAALSEARARATALATAVDRYEELARVEALALEEGVGVQADWLDAQAGLADARSGLARARRGEVLARAALARALGRLDPEWIEDTLEAVP